MKIILINPNPNLIMETTSVNLAPPMGLHVIGSFLMKNGYDIILIDTRMYSIEYVNDILKKHLPDTDFVGMSVMTAQISSAIYWCEKINSNKSFNGKIIWGGIHPSILPEQVVEGGIDYAIIGEGEQPILDLVEGKKELKDIKGICYNDGNKIIKTNNSEPFDMGRIPLTEWSLLPIEKYLKTYFPYQGNLRQVQIQTSRGCSYQCTFCVNTILPNYNKWRVRPIDSVREEIRVAKEELHADEIAFRDENFFIDKNRALEIAKICKEYGLKWEANCRANYFRDNFIDKEYLKQLEENGCIGFGIGAESGTNRILKKLKKAITTDDIIRSAEMLSHTKITGLYSFMTGIPTETKKEMMNTVNIMKKLVSIHDKIFFSNVAILRPYIGSEIYKECLTYGYKDPTSLIGWANEDLVSFRGAKDLSDYPWIKKKDANFVYAISLYTQFGLTPLNLAPSKGIWFFTLLSKIRLKLNFWYLPYEYKIFLWIKKQVEIIIKGK